MICTLCPRKCGAVRTAERGGGYCGMPSTPVLARAALHRWEEPPISGTQGSGAIFFSGCSLQCVFCQNEPISHGRFGKPVPEAKLPEIAERLVRQGAHNINLVNPTHYADAIGRMLAKKYGVPIVWNTGGYERTETLRALEGKVDIYLPDLKYMTPALAERYSGAADYPHVAQEAIREMVRQTGPAVFGGDGLLKRGTVIRHLILPGRAAEAKRVMDWVSETFPPGTVLFSLMSQYTPAGRASEFPEIDRKLRRREAETCEEYMCNLGLEGYCQDPDSASGRFIPAFDLTGLE